MTRIDLGQLNDSDRNGPLIVRKGMEGSGGRWLDYLQAFPPGAPPRCVGIIDGPADQTIIDDIDERVFSPLRSRAAASTW